MIAERKLLASCILPLAILAVNGVTSAQDNTDKNDSQSQDVSVDQSAERNPVSADADGPPGHPIEDGLSSREDVSVEPDGTLDVISLPSKPLPTIGDVEDPTRGKARGVSQLEEIVVTATKREESIRDIAGSVAALSGEQLEKSGVQNIDDVIETVPGVNIADSNNGNAKRITVRGISAGVGLGAPTTGIFIGDTPFSDVQSRSQPDVYPLDLASIEVLKGPVGTLFGGSGLNGAVRYILEQPVLDEWQGKAFYEVRGFSQGSTAGTYGGVINAPIDDYLAIRASAFDRETAGYVDSTHPLYSAEDVNSTNQTGQRAILRWMPLHNLDLSAMYMHQKTLTHDFATVTSTDGSFDRSDTPSPSPVSDEYDLMSLTGTWSLSFMDIVVNVAEVDKTADVRVDASNRTGLNQPPLPILILTGQSDRSPSIREVRFVSTDDGGDWDWLVGFFGYTDSLTALSTLGTQINGPLGDLTGTIGSALRSLGLTQGVLLGPDGSVNLLYTNLFVDLSEKAVFSEVNWRFADDWQLTTGLRYYLFDYDYLTRESSILGPTLNPTDLQNPNESRGANSESGFSPKLSLRWEPSNELMLYTTAARGFRIGGVNGDVHPEIPATYDSDSLWSFEIGTRTQWLDNTIVADATVFHILWDDAQTLVATSDGVLQYTDNVGKVTGLGIEASLTWLPPIDGISITSSVAWTDIKTAIAFEEAPEGTSWPLSPPLQSTTSVAWRTFGSWDTSVALTHVFTSETRQTLEYETEVFGYQTWALQFGLSSPAMPWFPEVALNLNNLTDKRGVVFVNDFAANSMAYIAPRNASLRLTFKF